MTDITAIGEVLIDLTQTEQDQNGVELFAANPGGSPANVAVAAARLGAQTAFLGKVGEDSMGQKLKKTLMDNGVDTTGLLTESAPTTVAVATPSENGHYTFSFIRGADACLTPEEVSEEQVAHTKVLHFSSASLTAGPSRCATIFAARHAHHSGVLVSFDPNYRPSLWNTPEDAEQWMTIPLPIVDVIKLSKTELEMITGTRELEEGSRILEAQGISLILITLGSEGVFFRWKGETGVVPGVRASVSDTIGAGDAFMGAVLSRLCARGLHPLAGLETRELRDILQFANRAAAYSCGSHGAIPSMPTLAQLNSTESRIKQ